MSKMKLVFIGCGDFANVTAIAAKLNRNIELYGCFDINTDASNAFFKKHGLKKQYDSYEEAIKGNGDALYLPIPHFLHYDYIKKGLLNNKHVFTEKPLCLTLEQSKEVSNLAKEKELILSVNFHNRYVKKVKKLKDDIENGKMGEHVMTLISIPWSRDEGYINPQNWHGKKELAGGGSLITQAIHSLDIALMLIKIKPKSIYCVLANLKFKDIETEDTAALNIQYDNGSIIQLATTMSLSKEKKAGIKYYGTKGQREINLPSSLGFIIAVYKSLNDFYKSTISKKLPENYCENFLLTTKVVEDAYKSAETNKIIQWSE